MARQQAQTSLNERLKNWAVALRTKFASKREITELEADALLEMLRKLAQNHGQDGVETAVKLCLVQCDFLPNEQQILERVPSVKFRTNTDPNCPDCFGMGWQRIEPENRFSPVQRCHCWRKERIA